MFSKINKLWNDYGFELVVGISIALILLLALFKIGKKGTWSSSYSYNNSAPIQSSSSRRGPPKDSKGELECRRVLQKLFNKPFNSCRPDFLRNPVTGGNFNLEIDCYEHGMRLGVEYNGVQHYKYNSFMHQNNRAKFTNQKYRDDMKRRICREKRINLIEVPYTVKINDIEGFLVEKLKMMGYLK